MKVINLWYEKYIWKIDFYIYLDYFSHFFSIFNNLIYLIIYLIIIKLIMISS